MGREKRWKFRFQDQAETQRLEQLAGVSPLVAQLLANRGLVESADIQRFLENRLSDLRDPNELPGVTEAVEIILASIEAGEKICVYGDYDVDGMTSTAILVHLFEALNADVIYYIPNRLDEGYGLNDDAIRELKKRGVQLIISVDCGIASVQQAAVARELGLKLIITDHHQYGAELPDAAALVHPALPGTNYPFHGLCGAGVAFKLSWAISQAHSGGGKATPRLRNLLMKSLGLAALGTVADVVPLLDENRALVKHGLTMLQQDPTVGVAELMRLTKLDKKPKLGAEDIGFVLGPRLNAAGRLGYARLGAELLMTHSQERAEALAEHIDNLNQDREKLERRISTAAKQMVNDEFDPESNPALVLASPDWHVGVIGIVAGRIAERYNRPTVLVSLDKTGMKPGTGSARSAGGVNLHEALSRCSDHLQSFGGHAAAAGLRVNESDLDAFRSDFCECVANASTETDTRPELAIDLEASLSQLTIRAIDDLERLAPFGQANPRPVFCATETQVVGVPKRMGGGERHLSVQIGQNGAKLRAVAFGKGEWADDLAAHSGNIDVAFRPVINEFAGRRTVELHLVDWRESQSVPKPHMNVAAETKSQP